MTTERTPESTLLYISRTRLVNDFARQIRECLAALTDEQLWWRPNDKSNAVGNLVLHLCGSTRYYIGYGLGRLPYDRDRPAEFAERGPIPREELLRRFDHAVDVASSVLGGLDPGTLGTTTDRTGKDTTLLQILYYQMLHFAVHLGQIVYTTKLLQEGALDELWMKTRS